ncbi:S1 family peptidase [Kibdelosporangium banguiense]|uniref:S1 family peptidase n=1 Tax=Kibdelosporangium banguiense TaxID=1365924 RepID=UPI0035569867
MQPNIIGGHAASEPYPWMVSLQINWKGDPNFHTCGGVLLFRDQVVTNAHCVTDPPGQTIPELGWHVRVGSHNRTTGGETAGVTKITVHPEWAWAAGAPQKRVADLAVLKLDRKLNLQTIELASTPAKPGDTVRLLGWGITEPDGTGPLPTMLQELDTRAVPASQCADALISGGESCIDNPHGTDGPCNGDSGGPALKKENGRWKLAGGASRGGSQWCGTIKSVYTSSPEYRQWIYDTARGVPVPSPVGALPVPPKDPGYGLPFDPGGVS